jgi:hypothetical protein
MSRAVMTPYQILLNVRSIAWWNVCDHETEVADSSIVLAGRGRVISVGDELCHE